MSHEAICPCNLQCNFCQKKYCRFQLGCQTYATCFATCNEILFYPRRVFKNVRGILIFSYCDWFLPPQKNNQIFVARQVANFGVSHEEVFLVTRGSLATCNGTPFALQLARKICSCDMALSRRFLALKPR